MLNWRSVCNSREPAYEKAGTVIDVAIVPRTLSRFQIKAVRKTRYVQTKFAQDGMGYVELDCRFEVADAETVTLADVRDGIEPKTVFKSDDLNDALAFCQQYMMEN